MTKKLLSVVVLSFLLLFCSCDFDDGVRSDAVSSSRTTYHSDIYKNSETIVYVTRTGECYHRRNCSYLKSRIETTLEEAVEDGYRRCSRCSPPKLISK